jgi:hypothetical protein
VTARISFLLPLRELTKYLAMHFARKLMVQETDLHLGD